MKNLNLIDFLIVGAQKAGTSSLFSVLNTHSNITGSKFKETHFFDTEELYIKGYNCYHNFFDFNKRNEKCLFFEATPVYLYHPFAAERIFSYNKNMKIIITLRNPIYRALSAWNMYHNYFLNHPIFFKSYDPRNFETAIREEIENIQTDTWFNNKQSYLKRGIYYEQIKKYLEFFPRENILIINYEDIELQNDKVMYDILNFLQIKFEKLNGRIVNQGIAINKSIFKKELMLLNEFYNLHNEQLFDLLNKKYNWSCDK